MAKRAKISSSDGCYKSWSWFYKSRSWFYNSVIRKNKSAIKKNYSATCEGNLPNHAHGMDFPLLARACIRIWFPEKSIHPFTRRVFSADFHRFPVWRLAFPSVHMDSKITVKGWFCKPSPCKTDDNQLAYHKISSDVNTWKSNPSHPNFLKISRKGPSCERVNTFSGIKKRI